MKYKTIMKYVLAAVAASSLFAACVKTREFDEITEVKLARCLEPQKLSGKVDVTTGDYVTFGWTVNKDAGEYELVVYKDEARTQEEFSWTLSPDQVPFKTRLTADEDYWFTVQAYRVDADGLKVAGSESVVAVYDGKITTYAVKDNLFLEVSGRTASSVSLKWSNKASDYKEVTHLTAHPVKGGDDVTKELNTAEATAAAATVDGLDASKEYQVTLFYKSASRGAVDTWTLAAPGTMTVIGTEEELKAAVAAGGEYFLSASAVPYPMGTAKPATSLTLVGELDADGKMPVVTGAVDISSVIADGSSIRLENVYFADDASNSFLINFSDNDNAVSLNKVEVVNCEISGYKSGIFYNNKAGGLTVSEILFEGCLIHNIVGSGGDCFDLRKKTTVGTVRFSNNTIWDGARTFVRIDGADSNGNDMGVDITNFVFENNTVKGISVVKDSNNQGLFAIKKAMAMTLKKNIFLWEDGGETDEATPDKAQLFRDNEAIVVPTLTASDNYAYAVGKDFFKKVTAAEAGFTDLTEDPCYNSKGNYFQLENPDLIKAKVGASKWWISYVEQEEDLTQNVITEAHTWNLLNATLFAGEVKNSRVRDELLLVGTEATPLNADDGINFLSATELNKKGIPTAGYLAFKVKNPGSVDLQVSGGSGAGVVVALYDDNGLSVLGGAIPSATNPGVQKVVVNKVTGDGTLYLYSTGAVSLVKLAWSTDVLAGNKVLAAPKPVVEPVTLTEGDEVDVTVTWEAVPNAASYVVVFNKHTQPAQTELSFTVPAAEIAELKAGLYNFTVQALPADDDIYYVKSELGAASVAIQPQASAGEQVVNVDLVWDFSTADWQTAFAAKGNAGDDITAWDLTIEGLQFYSKTKSKYNATYMQFGGAGINKDTGDWDRYFKFTAPEQGTLKITVSNTSGTADMTRTVRVKVGDEDPESIPAGFASTAAQEIEFSIKAGDVMITAPENGLRFYKIEYHYSYTTGGEAPAPIEYDWDFSTADWQTAFAAKGNAGDDITAWDLTIEGLQFYSKTKSKYNATYMQFGGAGINKDTGDWDRYFKFTAPEQGTLKITVSNTSGTADMTRTVRVKVGDEDPESIPAGFASTAAQEIEFSIKAGDVMITAPENGLRFYKIHYINQ